MSNQIFMYVSLWNRYKIEGAEGLGLFSFDTQSGSIEFIKRVNDEHWFNYSLIDSQRGLMYLCNETEQVKGIPYSTGRIYGYHLDPETGGVTELFHRETGCPSPCYLNLDATGKHMVVVHHSSLSNITTIEKGPDGKYYPEIRLNDPPVQLYSVNEDGSLGELLDVIKHVKQLPAYNLEGKPMDTRAPHPNHPHSCLRSPSGKLFCTPDKGDGYIYMYTIDNGALKLLGKHMSDEEDSRPRYCHYHPTKPFLFINHENLTQNDLRVTSFRYDEEGNLDRIGIYSALENENKAIDPKKIYSQQGFCIHPSGKYLYSLCRNPTVVAVFAIDQDTGELSLQQNAHVEGDFPRGLALSPDGRFLVTACVMGGEIAVYEVGEDGKLSATGSTANLKGGSYINFYCPLNK